jgi:SlyX protein
MSRQNPRPASDADERITELEIKLSYTEDLLDTLNTMVIQQQDQIDRLLREVGQLRHQGGEDGQARFRSLRDELPPHY